MRILREWQTKSKDEIKIVIAKDDKTDDEKLVSISASVGSGKTFVAFEAFIDYLDIHKPKKSIQMFVCPRINLCHQQRASFEKDYKDEIERLGIVIKEWNCDSDDFSDRNADTMWTSSAKHYVIFIVDESIWGTTKVQGKNNEEVSVSRFDAFNKKLDKAAELGFEFGVIAYDEAHNYQTNQDKMFGDTKYLSTYWS